MEGNVNTANTALGALRNKMQGFIDKKNNKRIKIQHKIVEKKVKAFVKYYKEIVVFDNRGFGGEFDVLDAIKDSAVASFVTTSLVLLPAIVLHSPGLAIASVGVCGVTFAACLVVEKLWSKKDNILADAAEFVRANSMEVKSRNFKENVEAYQEYCINKYVEPTNIKEENHDTILNS